MFLCTAKHRDPCSMLFFHLVSSVTSNLRLHRRNKWQQFVCMYGRMSLTLEVTCSTTSTSGERTSLIPQMTRTGATHANWRLQYNVLSAVRVFTAKICQVTSSPKIQDTLYRTQPACYGAVLIGGL